MKAVVPPMLQGKNCQSFAMGPARISSRCPPATAEQSCSVTLDPSPASAINVALLQLADDGTLKRSRERGWGRGDRSSPNGDPHHSLDAHHSPVATGPDARPDR